MIIDGYDIRQRCRPYLIAELSGNHGGDMTRMYALIAAALHSGADAIKLQCYEPEKISADVPINWGGDVRSARALYLEAHTPRQWFDHIFKDFHGHTIFASVFSEADADFVAQFDPPAYKISSFDIVDTGLIRHVSAFGKPIFISTGGATVTEIMAAAAAAGDCPHLFLHCVSEYPTAIEHAHLGRIRAMQGFIRPPLIGLSDHSLGHDIAVAATAMGVVAIEKHFIIDRAAGGPDSSFSMEPVEFQAMAKAVKDVHSAISHARAAPLNKTSFYRKSLFYAHAVAAGTPLQETDVRTMRPNLGIHPALLPSVLGRCARHDLAAGSPVSMDDFFAEPD